MWLAAWSRAQRSERELCQLLKASGQWLTAVKQSCFKADWAVTWTMFTPVPSKKGSMTVCWALVIPLANESRAERHAMGPLGSLQPGVSGVCYRAWLVSTRGTKASPNPVPFPLPSHQLPSGCLFSVTQLGWILLKIWRLVRTQRCLERLPLIINTTAGNDVVEKKKKSPWSTTHSLWCFCSEFTAQRKRYEVFFFQLWKKSSLTFSNHNHMTFNSML